MKEESSEPIEEVLGLDSFKKGLKAEIRKRLREERNTMLTLAGVFVVGIVIGFLVTNKSEVN